MAAGTRSLPQLRKLRKKPWRTTNSKMAIKDKGSEEPLDWNVDVEVQLFYAMRGHKPVGVNRHFQMACILEKFRNSIQKDISSQQIWDHLETMYDMDALHDSEILPFPNEEVEFILPEPDFGQLMKQDTKDTKKDEKSKDDKEGKEEKEKEKPTKGSKSKQHQLNSAHDEKESKHSPAKGISKEKHKEIKDADSAENSPKRKRSIRSVHQDHGSKPSSPATKEPTPKRRRT